MRPLNNLIKLPNRLNVNEVEIKMLNADFIRAGKDCICSICEQVYGKHPSPIGIGYEYMNELCDRTLIKL